MSVKVVTDSTADLPAEVARELDITVVPLYVHFGSQVFRDGVDLSAEEFYRKLLQGPTLPTTSAPSPGTFQEIYEKLSSTTEEIISLHVSSKLSATHQSALLAKEQGKLKGRVEVMDSQTVSMGLGLLAILAAKAAKGGAKLDEILALVRQAIPHTHFFGLLDTLEYLQKGGRIGKAQAFLGTLLSVKPILSVREGEVHPVERVRTRSKALERLFELTRDLCPAEEMAVFHSTAPQEADALSERLKTLYGGKEPYRSRFGPVLGTYVGPGALGMALIQETR